MKSETNENDAKTILKEKLPQLEEYSIYEEGTATLVSAKMASLGENLHNRPEVIIPLGVVMSIFGVINYIHSICDMKSRFQVAVYSIFWLVFISIFFCVIIRGIKLAIVNKK